jgi:hypothetical protein
MVFICCWTLNVCAWAGRQKNLSATSTANPSTTFPHWFIISRLHAPRHGPIFEMISLSEGHRIPAGISRWKFMQWIRHQRRVFEFETSLSVISFTYRLRSYTIFWFNFSDRGILGDVRSQIKRSLRYGGSINDLSVTARNSSFHFYPRIWSNNSNSRGFLNQVDRIPDLIRSPATFIVFHSVGRLQFGESRPWHCCQDFGPRRFLPAIFVLGTIFNEKVVMTFQKQLNQTNKQGVWVHEAISISNTYPNRPFVASICGPFSNDTSSGPLRLHGYDEEWFLLLPIRSNIRLTERSIIELDVSMDWLVAIIMDHSPFRLLEDGLVIWVFTTHSCNGQKLQGYCRAGRADSWRLVVVA